MKRRSWITQVDLKSNNPCPYKTKGRSDREDRGRDRSDTVMQSRTVDSPQSWKRQRNILLQSPHSSAALLTP